MRPRQALLRVATVCLVGLVGGGNGGCSRASFSHPLILVDGSSTLYPLMEALAEDFRQVRPDIAVGVGISGTSGGFQRFCRGETVVQNASRPIHDAERSLCASNGIEAIELPVAYDAIVVAVHPSNTWALSLTTSELKRLWEPAAQARVRRWSDIRPEWPAHLIRLFGAGVQSGTYERFTATIVGEAGSSRGDYMASEDDHTLAQGIANDHAAIGFFGYAYLEANRMRVRAVAIADDRDGVHRAAVMPTPLTIRSGQYRPLTRPLYVYVNREAIADPRVSAFLAFAMAHAPALCERLGYVALPAAELETALRQLALLTDARAREFSAATRPDDAVRRVP